MKLILKSVFLLLLMSIFSNSQAQTFKAGFILGGTGAQINGDRSAGFNRLGLETGIFGGFDINEKLGLNFEILYSQRGSVDVPKENVLEEVDISLSYISIPVIISFKDWLTEDYYKINAHAGLNYGRLFSASRFGDKEDPLATALNKNDFTGLIGISYYTNEHLFFTVRYNRGITLLFKSKLVEGILYNSLLSHFLSFRIGYQF